MIPLKTKPNTLGNIMLDRKIHDHSTSSFFDTKSNLVIPSIEMQEHDLKLKLGAQMLSEEVNGVVREDDNELNQNIEQKEIEEIDIMFGEKLTVKPIAKSKTGESGTPFESRSINQHPYDEEDDVAS